MTERFTLPATSPGAAWNSFLPLRNQKLDWLRRDADARAAYEGRHGPFDFEAVVGYLPDEGREA